MGIVTTDVHGEQTPALRLPQGLSIPSGLGRAQVAAPGTFRLVPPPARLAALARDYATMAPMFIGMPIEFDVMLQRLHAAERQLNNGSLLGLDGS